MAPRTTHKQRIPLAHSYLHIGMPGKNFKLQVGFGDEELRSSVVIPELHEGGLLGSFRGKKTQWGAGAPRGLRGHCLTKRCDGTLGGRTYQVLRSICSFLQVLKGTDGFL